MSSHEYTREKSDGKKIAIIIIAVILALITALVSTFFILQYMGKKKFHENDKNISASVEGLETDYDDDSISYNGNSYVLNDNIVSVLCLGIDKKNIDNNLGYGKNGQADSVFVAAIDSKTKKVTIIPIPRETMVDVNVYTASGEFAETKREQICLAYAYGNSAESSSENMKLSVSRALYGINISSYVTVDLTGIGKISDAVGGVKVTCIEDLNGRGGIFKVGNSLNLKGDDAIFYIQNRGGDIDASTRRLARQKQFLSAFASTAGNQILQNFTKLKTYYDIMKPYTSTDLSFSQITYLVSSCLSTDIGSKLEYKTVAGSAVLGEKFVEFTPDEQSLTQTIIDVFYTEKN